MAAIALHHREILVLAAAMEAEPEAEPVGKRNLLLDRFARIDRGGALVLDHLARQQVSPVGGGVQDHVVGTSLDAAFQHRLERLVGSVIAVERQVVAEHDEAEFGGAQKLHQRRQALDILAMDLDQFKPVGRLAVQIDAGMRRLDQRRFAHAARSPQQRIVGGKAVGEALGVLDQDVAHPLDPLQKTEVDAADPRHRRQPPVGVPDEGVGGGEGIGRIRGRRGGGQVCRDRLERASDPLLDGAFRRCGRAFCRGRCGFGGYRLGGAARPCFIWFFWHLRGS